MKLSEALQKNKGKSIRVGMQKGSAFVFCGWADEKADEMLKRYLDRNVVQTYKNYLGGLNIILEGKESGDYWTAVECIGVDIDRADMITKPIEAYHALVGARYKVAAEELKEALIDLAPVREAHERSLRDFNEALDHFLINKNISKNTKLGEDVVSLRAKVLETMVEMSKINDKIRRNENFIRSGTFEVSPSMSDHIICKVKMEAEEEIAERKIQKNLQKSH